MIKFGLVIQGPTISYGQGPNNFNNGYNAIPDILENINKFNNFVEHIVVSTWENSGLKLSKSNKLTLIESKVPTNINDDNRYKQFFTLKKGIEILKNYEQITHVLKIRTDQIIDPNIITWLSLFFEKNNYFNKSENFPQEDYIFFSDSQIGNKFYLGDFVFSGKIEDINRFCNSNLTSPNIILHPSIGKNYILKYLSINDKLFYKIFLKYYPLLMQCSNTNNKIIDLYWNKLLSNRFRIIPNRYYSNIIWRGKNMFQILPNFNSHFLFYENFVNKNFNCNLKINKINRFLNLIPCKQVLKELRYELLIK
jgi:hypothetical protein